MSLERLKQIAQEANSRKSVNSAAGVESSPTRSTLDRLKQISEIASQREQYGQPSETDKFIEKEKKRELPSYVHWSRGAVKHLSPEQQVVWKQFQEGIPETRNRRLKLFGQEAAASPLGAADVLHGTYNLGSTLTNAAGLTDAEPYSEEEMPSLRMRKWLQENTPINPNAIQPVGRGERSLVQGIRAAGATAASLGAGNAAIKGLGALAGSAPRAAKYGKTAAEYLLGSADTLNKGAGITAAGGAIGAGANELGERGINVGPAMAGLAALPIGTAAYRGGKNAVSKAGKFIDNLYPTTRGYNEAAKLLEGVVGQEKIPSVLKNIEAERVAPSMYGYEPPTAHIANNTGLSMLHDVYGGQPKMPELTEGINERVAKNVEARKEGFNQYSGEGTAGPLAAKEYLQKHGHATQLAKEAGVEGALKQFEDQQSADTAGGTMRSVIEKELEQRKAERSKVAKDPYEVANSIEEPINAKNAKKFLADQAKGLPDRAKLRKTLGTLGDLLQDEGSITSPVSKLSGAVGIINGKIGEAVRKGDTNMARILRGLKDSIDVDLESHPQVKNARQIYAKASGPVNQILQDPLLSQVIKKSDFDAQYITPNSAVPEKLINSAAGSESVALKIKEMFGKNKDFMDSFMRDQNRTLIDAITDEHGHPKEAKIAQYLKNNKGAIILYPGLETKLGNTRNATAFLNDMGNQAYKDSTALYNSTLKSLTGVESHNFANALFSGNNPMGKIDKFLEIAKTDPTGNAIEGARRATINYASQHATSPAAFMKFYGKGKRYLEKILQPEQIKFLDEVNKHYSQEARVAKQAATPTGNSLTAPRLKKMELIEKGVAKSLPRTIMEELLEGSGAQVAAALGKGTTGFVLATAAKATNRWWKNMVANSMQKNIQQILLNPDYAKGVLTDISTKAGQAKAKALLEKSAKNKYNGYVMVRPSMKPVKPREDDEE